jgi:hypothetical protein
MTKAPVDFSTGDDLNDIFGAPSETPRSLPEGDAFARIRSYADQAPIAQPFVATCGACRGRGRFVSYAGRDIGPCYKCKGTGKTSHKTSPQVRAKARERRVEQAAAVTAEAQPQIKWLQDKLLRREKLPEGYATMLSEFLIKLASGRPLSDGQMAVIAKGQARDAEWAAQRAQETTQRVQAAPVVDVAKIVDAFQRAQESGLKRFTLRFSGAHFQVDRTDPSLIWISEGGYGTAMYGRIAGGVFRPGRDASAEVVARIQAIAADPLAAGIAYAQVTSSCSVCGRHLENQDSVDAGVGPICSGRLASRPGAKFVEVKSF